MIKANRNKKKNQNKRRNKRMRKNNNQMVSTNGNVKPQIIYIREPKQKKESTLFDSLGGLITKGLSYLISGFGDYKVNENTLLTGGINPPEVVNSANDGGVIVRHREYLGDVNATIDFTPTRYFINPGLSSTFPWLSNIALSFEQYRIRGMLFEYKSLSSDAVLSSATSSALGAVIMSTQYDVLDDIFPDKFTMENYLYANSDKPSCSFIHPIECKKNQTSVSELYTRDETIPNNADQRLYDLGVFTIATVGMQAASGVAGELWCTYEIELYKPKIPELDEGQGAFDHFQLTSPVAATPLGASAVNAPTATLLGTVTLGTTYTFPSTVDLQSTYFVYWQLTGSSSASIIGATITATNCTKLARFDADSVTQKANGGTGVTTATVCFVVRIDNVNATLVWSTGGTYPTGTTT